MIPIGTLVELTVSLAHYQPEARLGAQGRTTSMLYNSDFGLGSLAIMIDVDFGGDHPLPVIVKGLRIVEMPQLVESP